MNLKKTAFSLFAATALSLTMATPIVSAQNANDANPNNNNTTASVNVHNTGEFDAYFTTSFGLTTQTVNASPTAATATGSFSISYVDTLVYRPKFDVKVTAGDFQSGTNVISADGFTVTQTHNVGSYQWGGSPTDPTVPSANALNVPPVIGDIGDIGFMVDGNYVGSQSPHPRPWTSAAPSLGEGVKVHYGYAGIGTIGSVGKVDVALQVPGGTSAGVYTSQVTLTVMAGTAP